jgi:hypothetical protein
MVFVRKWHYYDNSRSVGASTHVSFLVFWRFGVFGWCSGVLEASVVGHTGLACPSLWNTSLAF